MTTNNWVPWSRNMSRLWKHSWVRIFISLEIHFIDLSVQVISVIVRFVTRISCAFIVAQIGVATHPRAGVIAHPKLWTATPRAGGTNREHGFATQCCCIQCCGASFHAFPPIVARSGWRRRGRDRHPCRRSGGKSSMDTLAFRRARTRSRNRVGAAWVWKSRASTNARLDSIPASAG